MAGGMELFLYGSLLDPQTLERRSGVPGLARFLRPARIVGWRRVVPPGWHYPTLCRARGGRVEGALLTLPAGALARLTAYEGASYRIVRLVPEEKSRPRSAHAFIASTRRNRPGCSRAVSPSPSTFAP
ncbi:MAG: gamma-glutamylcyclotransferase family protein [Acetobacteraceae bacterium]